MRALFIGLAMALSAGPLAAQDQPSVRGLIITGNGQPVPGYPVIVDGPGDTNHVVLTDKTGVFTLHDLPQGLYTATPANQADRPVPFELQNGVALQLEAIELVEH